MEEPVIAVPEEVRNNAELMLTGPMIPVVNPEPYDVDQQIWKATILERTREYDGSPATTVFYRNTHDPENNDIDKVWSILKFDSPDLVGKPFELIPTNKLLFFYKEDSIILTPVSHKPSLSRQ